MKFPLIQSHYKRLLRDGENFNIYHQILGIYSLKMPDYSARLCTHRHVRKKIRDSLVLLIDWVFTRLGTSTLKSNCINTWSTQSTSTGLKTRGSTIHAIVESLLPVTYFCPGEKNFLTCAEKLRQVSDVSTIIKFPCKIQWPSRVNFKF